MNASKHLYGYYLNQIDKEDRRLTNDVKKTLEQSASALSKSMLEKVMKVVR